MMYIMHQGSVLSYKNGFNPLNGCSPEWMDIPLNVFPLYDYRTSKVVNTTISLIMVDPYDLPKFPLK